MRQHGDAGTSNCTPAFQRGLPKPYPRLTAGASCARRGFTLIELLVVIGIIALLAIVALPSVNKLFTAGSDAQAYNTMSALLTGARALAIQQATYTCVHVQPADNVDLQNPQFADVAGATFACVMIYNPTNQNFIPADGFSPRQMPGGIGFGEITNYFIDTTFVPEIYKQTTFTDPDLANFLTFSIVFSPSGSVVRNVNGNNIVFAETPSLIAVEPPDPNDPNVKTRTTIWSSTNANRPNNTGEEGVFAMTMFDAGELTALPADERANYLNRTGQYLPINVYTGQLFPRK